MIWDTGKKNVSSWAQLMTGFGDLSPSSNPGWLVEPRRETVAPANRQSHGFKQRDFRAEKNCDETLEGKGLGQCHLMRQITFVTEIFLKCFVVESVRLAWKQTRLLLGSIVKGSNTLYLYTIVSVSPISRRLPRCHPKFSSLQSHNSCPVGNWTGYWMAKLWTVMRVLKAADQQ